MRRVERPKSLAESVLTSVRAMIVHGDIALGQALSERQLADEIGVSKTPVREALAQLRTEGLIRIVPQRGAFVFTLSAREVIEIAEFRLALEEAALRLSFARAPEALAGALAAIVARMTKARRRGDVRAYLDLDTAYHAAFFASCGNLYLRESYNRYVGKIAALRTHLAAKPLHTKLSYAEHRGMLQAIVAADIAGALAILTVHIGRTRRTYTADIEDITAADRPLSEAS